MNSEKEDIPVMLDCLHELFNEYGDMVTPTLLIQRMEQKLHRRLPMHVMAHLYTSQGIVTKRLNRQNNYCIIPKFELLAEKRAEYCSSNIYGEATRSDKLANQ